MQVLYVASFFLFARKRLDRKGSWIAAVGLKSFLLLRKNNPSLNSVQRSKKGSRSTYPERESKWSMTRGLKAPEVGKRPRISTRRAGSG